jgi:hypothetical protein
MGDVPDILHDIDGPCWAMFTAAAPPFRPGPLSLPGKGEAGTQGEEMKFPVGWLAAGPALVCLLSALWRCHRRHRFLAFLLLLLPQGTVVRRREPRSRVS